MCVCVCTYIEARVLLIDFFFKLSALLMSDVVKSQNKRCGKELKTFTHKEGRYKTLMD